MIGMKTVCFFISPLQLKVNCLLLTLCCLDLQQLHCFRRYGALVVTISYDVQVPEHVGTFTWVDSQSGHFTVIFLLSLLHWGSTSPTRGSPFTRSSRSEVNRTASNSVPSFFSMVGDPMEVYGTIVHFPGVDVGKAHTQELGYAFTYTTHLSCVGFSLSPVTSYTVVRRYLYIRTIASAVKTGNPSTVERLVFVLLFTSREYRTIIGWLFTQQSICRVHTYRHKKSAAWTCVLLRCFHA